MASTSRGGYQFLGIYDDDMSILESGLYKKSYDIGHSGGNFHHHLHDDDDDEDQSGAAAAAGKSNDNIDPRLLMLLKYFRELYAREAELFKKVFPGIHEEFAEAFRKIGAMLSQVKMQQSRVKTMQRSLSLGSHRTRGIGGGEPPGRLQRFKVRTVVVDGGIGQGQGAAAGSGGQGGQGDTKSISSK